MLESLLSLTVLWFTLKNQAILLDFLQFFLKTLFSKDTQEDDQTSAKNAHTKIRETYFVHCSSVALARGIVATDSHDQTFRDATPMLLSGCIELHIVQTVWLDGSTKKRGISRQELKCRNTCLYYGWTFYSKCYRNKMLLVCIPISAPRCRSKASLIVPEFTISVYIRQFM